MDQLRANGKAIVSLVAVENDQIVGYILFSEVTLSDATISGLAPLAVRPSQQKQGIGAQLTQAGIEACRNAGYTAMFGWGILTITRASALCRRVGSASRANTM